MTRLIFPILLVALTGTASVHAQTKKRPNILWIVSEDNSPLLGCYGDEIAQSPNIDNLASEGILYSNAFANAPVCAPARSTLASGLYPPSMGTQHMRSKNPLPSEILWLSQVLQKAGYHCTNAAKTDYNRAKTGKELWNESSSKAHWRKRKNKQQPFFAVFNISTSHESSLHRHSKPTRDPKTMKLPPYHPDLPEIRRDWAQYYDKITSMDGTVGKILGQLKEDGLTDDTIVFYYGDHGGILTRSKRFLYDSGTRVPMIVRFGKNFSMLAPAKAGTKTDRLVSFVDLYPTVLSLVGADIPQRLQGEAFLGTKSAPERKYVYLFRGRMDERYDMQRAIRDKQYKYIRNHNPHRIYGQHLNYLWKMTTTKAWQAHYKAGKCNAAQKIFWETKPTEELYDTHTDPSEVRNLAADPAHKQRLEAMRAETRRWALDIRDSGFMPEGMMLERAGNSTVHAYVRSKEYPLERIVETAEMATDRSNTHIDEWIKRMSDPDGAVRYWAATGCIIHSAHAKAAVASLEKLLNDPYGDVQLAAAEALIRMGMVQKGLPAIQRNFEQKAHTKVALRAINTMQALGSDAAPLLEALKNHTKSKDGYVTRAGDWAIQSQLK